MIICKKNIIITIFLLGLFVLYLFICYKYDRRNAPEQARTPITYSVRREYFDPALACSFDGGLYGSNNAIDYHPEGVRPFNDVNTILSMSNIGVLDIPNEQENSYYILENDD